jgi:hypothetical protein
MYDVGVESSGITCIPGLLKISHVAQKLRGHTDTHGKYGVLISPVHPTVKLENACGSVTEF